ncbi:hypothetical protein C8J56DRAFT_1068199 [Mycena floridula]|nr:hypothetical protein C8J56DRAFT_1068199 [Mycena floridula]
MFEKLPSELLEEICKLSLPAELSRLCQTCHVLDAIAKPLLYRKVTLYAASQLDHFCQSVINSGKRKLPGFIVDFSFISISANDILLKEAPESTPGGIFLYANTDNRVSRMLGVAKNLRKLQIHVAITHPSVFADVWKCRLPKLQSLVIGSLIGLYQNMGPFLQAHGSTLTSLVINFSSPDGFVVETVEAIPLPKLENYSGPDNLLRLIIKSSPATKLQTIIVEFIDPEYEQTFRLLAQSSSKSTCHTLTCLKLLLPEQLLISVATLLPDTVNLSVRLHEHMVLPETWGLDLLAPFRRLESVAFHSCKAIPNIKLFRVTLDQWAESGPATLRHFRLTSGGQVRHWYTHPDPEKKKSVSWIMAEDVSKVDAFFAPPRVKEVA